MGKMKKKVAWFLVIIFIATQFNWSLPSNSIQKVYAQEGSLASETDPNEETCDITGKVVFMGMEELAASELSLVLEANGVAVTDKLPTLTPAGINYKGVFPIWEYTFEGVKINDEQGEAINYLVKNNYDFSSGNVELFYIAEGAVVAKGNENCDNKDALQVWVGKAGIAGSYIGDGTADSEAVTFALTTVDAEDSEFATGKQVWLEGSDTWMSDKCIKYNPLTGEQIVYRVQISENADDFLAFYSNVSPYQEESAYAYNGGTIENIEQDRIPEFKWNGNDRVVYKVTVNWNDNDREDRMDPVIELYYHIGEETALITQDVLMSWGMSETDAEAQMRSIRNAAHVESYNNWVYTYSLPKELIHSNAKAGKTVAAPKTITYSFKLANQSDIEKEYFVKYESDTRVMNTLKTTMSFDLIWKDSSNRYETRPADITDKLVLCYSITKEGITTNEEVGTLSGIENLAITGTKYTISELPK